MPIPPHVRDSALRHVELFCQNRIPEEARDEFALEAIVRGDRITIVERRAPWSDRAGAAWTTLKVAQLRYDAGTGLWRLFACDRSEHWYAYELADP